MSKIHVLLSSLLITIALHGQELNLKFNQQYLDKPIQYSYWFDSNLKVEYIGKYIDKVDTLTCLLINGYAGYHIQNPYDYSKWKNNYTVSKVDILFTDYPKRKEDWITNYYELLANRLKELLLIDPSLNSKEIEWRLVLQTDCNSGNQAKKLKHGIVIYFAPRFITEELSPNEEKQILIEILEGKKNEPDDSIKEKKVIPTKDRENLGSIPGEEAMIPLNVLHKIPMKEYKPPKRKKNRDEPGCPKFKTRADKPKKKIFRRLFN